MAREWRLLARTLGIIIGLQLVTLVYLIVKLG